MKQYVCLILLLIANLGYAQTTPEFFQLNKPVTCGPIEIIFKGLISEDVKEKPIWIGKNEDSKSEYAVFVNSKTGAFTIVQFGKEWGCILGMGYKSKDYLGNRL